ncbi:hypothetical protein EMCG_01550 [[Emmonsia] crescens]|uniref:Uncharacterized protein n=1 Tax=[Emmonsia] crescens TaxID=73230 RepID=A0A0G2J2I5_9EURO|nr:hypothetical protein EMCG_01550 [Emmonsia crescens UAMH 3008]
MQLVQHLHDGLEAQLQLSCPIDEFSDEFPSLNEFCRKVKNQEPAAYKLWSLNRQSSRAAPRPFHNSDGNAKVKPEFSNSFRRSNDYRKDNPRPNDRERNEFPSRNTGYRNGRENRENRVPGQRSGQDNWKKPARQSQENRAFHAAQEEVSEQEADAENDISDATEDDASMSDTITESKNEL